MKKELVNCGKIIIDAKSFLENTGASLEQRKRALCDRYEKNIRVRIGDMFFYTNEGPDFAQYVFLPSKLLKRVLHPGDIRGNMLRGLAFGPGQKVGWISKAAVVIEDLSRWLAMGVYEFKFFLKTFTFKKFLHYSHQAWVNEQKKKALVVLIRAWKNITHGDTP